MMYYAFSFAPFEQFFQDIGNAISGVLGFLQTLVESVVDFVKWLPHILGFFQTITLYIIPEFFIVALCAVTVYLIKIIVGGDNK